MPPLPLTSLVQSALPALSPDSRAVVRVLGCCNGQLTPTSVAQWLGLRTRYQVARLLRRGGGPALRGPPARAPPPDLLPAGGANGAAPLPLGLRGGAVPLPAAPPRS